MKIYLAGPMRGVPELNFPAFHRYAAKLRAQGHEVFNPAEVMVPQDNIRAVFALELDWICREAEAVYLMPGWVNSAGARAEQALAEALDLKIACLPGSPPTRLNGSHFPSGPPSSITSPSPSQKSLRFPLPDESSTEPLGGTGLSLLTKVTLLYATILSAGLLIMMGFDILQKWLGAH